jgi:hypothetical protein
VLKIPKLRIYHQKLSIKSQKIIRKVGKIKKKRCGPKSLCTVHPCMNSDLDSHGASKWA